MRTWVRSKAAEPSPHAENLLLWGVEQITAERQRADRLAKYLRVHRINPDEII